MLLTIVNFCFTAVGMSLVDRKGRKFLFILGTSGIILSMLATGTMFLRTEKQSIDCGGQIQSMVGPGQDLTLHFDKAEAQRLLSGQGSLKANAIEADRASFAIIYSYGDFTGSTSYVRSDDPAAAPLTITRGSAVPDNKVEAFFKNPFADLAAAQTAPLKIEKAVLGTVYPTQALGGLWPLCLYGFMAFYALGSRCLRVAGSIGADADAHPVQRHERCPGDQPACLDSAGRDLPTLREQARLFVDVLPVRRIHRGVLPYRGDFLLPETKRKTLEGD